MSTSANLKNFNETAQAFFDSKIKHFNPPMPIGQFNSMRLFFINMIIDNLNTFFDSPHKIHLAINNIQIVFNAWNEIPNSVSIKNEFFLFFFLAACLITIKLESPDQVKSFKNWVCDHDYDLHNVFRSERILLSEAHWDLCLDTPANMQDNILSEIFKDSPLNESQMEKVNDTVNTYLQYSLCEYELYSNFDMLTITLASVYLTVLVMEEDTEIKEKVVNYINDNCEIVNKEKISECCQSILKCIDKVEEKENEDEDMMAFINNKYANNANDIFSLYDEPKVKNAKDERASISTESESIKEYNTFLGKKRGKSKE